jgi:ABC-type polysaccharide/polyol phosphate transport system ATPase subunit
MAIKDWRLQSFAVECWPYYYVQNQRWLTTNPASVSFPLRLHGTESKIEYTTAFAFAAGATGGNSQSFDGKTVISDLNLTINNGEFLTLLGPSGCGKTTVLRLIAGLASTAAGSISKITISPMFRRKTATSIPSFKATPCFRI